MRPGCYCRRHHARLTRWQAACVLLLSAGLSSVPWPWLVQFELVFSGGREIWAKGREGSMIHESIDNSDPVAPQSSSVQGGVAGERPRNLADRFIYRSVGSERRPKGV